ncbi:GNAT family N-acetyltransferase [Cellulosimicrobium sp. Marseille-Q4280]|uniref:GNAT family N-acetyltransferase n=1 Tax=Cellulosimicrobium sp. Marseille-Q4280 TaxID=2937992 RepID=UPI00203AA402|nr:GNAT family N-acetyltransferase [Cellulosimicrobium sp. Marseille-Q4280]
MSSTTRTGTTTVRIDSVPASPDAPDAWAVHGSVLVSEAIDRQVYGHTDLALDAGTVVISVASGDYRRTVRRVAVVDGGADPEDPAGGRTPRPEDVVGRSMIALPLQGNTHTAIVYVGVHPDHRGRGIGTALWEDALAIAREAGRRVILADSTFAPEPPPGPDALEAPTGSGRIPRHDAATTFVLDRGFALEQVVRHSVLELPVPAERLDALRDDARRRADGYRVHVWTDEVPDVWIDQLAVLETRMSTDAPSAGLEIEEDPWDAQRVRTASQDFHDRGQGYVIAAAEHIPTGTLAGFSMVAYPHDKPEVVFQEDTLVLREHRGHGLGLLVKVAVLDELARSRPGSRRVHTWNAQENDHMLAINVALGFAPTSVDAEWQLRLEDAGDAPAG